MFDRCMAFVHQSSFMTAYIEQYSNIIGNSICESFIDIEHIMPVWCVRTLIGIYNQPVFPCSKSSM